jgi:hypothetical protein
MPDFEISPQHRNIAEGITDLAGLIHLPFWFILCLYPACKWFADLKRRRRDLFWLSYF